jgi:hypothetical protein
MPWEEQAPLLMIVPLAYLVAARLYRGRPSETPVAWAAHAGTLIMLASSLGTAFQGFVLQEGQTLNLLLAAFFAEAAVFYALAAAWRARAWAVFACTAAAAAAVWQLLKYFSVADEYYVGAFAVLGLLLLVGYRFAVPGRGPAVGLGRAAFQSAGALLSLGVVGGAVLTLFDLAGRPFDLVRLLGLHAVLLAAAAAAAGLVRQTGWRRWYAAAAIGNASLAALAVLLRFPLTPREKMELISLGVGVVLLAAGHVGWYREQERQSDLVTLALALGSLFVAVPLTVSVLYCRFTAPSFDYFHTLNEVGMLAAGLLLLAAGYSLHIKATTVTGAVVTALYLLTLVAFVRLPDMLKTTAAYLMIGGGLFFGVGLLLSIYRDRLLALPQKIKRREGIFRVLNWR